MRKLATEDDEEMEDSENVEADIDSMLDGGVEENSMGQWRGDG